jgi:hypothetical protein
MSTRKSKLRAKRRKQGEEVTVSFLSHEERRQRTFYKQSWGNYTPPPLPPRLLTTKEAKAMIAVEPYELIRGPGKVSK